MNDKATVVAPFSYTDKNTPDGYKCVTCSATGVRLYRRYQTFLDHQQLYCRECACKDQNKQPDNKSEHTIGCLVAAVPTEDGRTYWGFTSVPQEGVEWWNRLPADQQQAQPQ